MTEIIQEEFDPSVKIDDLPDQYAPPQEGTALLMLTRCEFTKNKAGDKYMLANRLQVIEPGRDKGKTFRDWIMLTKSRNGFGKLAEVTQAIDDTMKSIKQDPDNGFSPYDQDSINFHLLGQPFAGTIEHEEGEWNGKKTLNARLTKVREITKKEYDLLVEHYGTGEPRPDLPSDARSPWPSRKPEQSSGSAGASFNDDEIPF